MASGKSDLALSSRVGFRAPCAGGGGRLADALQLYLGWTGTAKTLVDVRRGSPPPIDVLEVRDEASVAAHQKHARADVAVFTRGGVAGRGGSGLYQRAA